MSVKPIHTFAVIPKLPPRLEPLRELAYNLHWAWDNDAIELFQRLDDDLWEATGHNPVRFLGAISQVQLEAAAADEGFLAHQDRVLRDVWGYLAGESTWFARAHHSVGAPLVAYFSAEFGLTECLSIFAGGLGLLAGDHLKSASDLGLPLVGVGLLYQEGYFRQYLSHAGWQQEAYVDNDFHNLPLRLERRPDGTPLTVAVNLSDQSVMAQIWRARVGRVSLYLLDTNLPPNSPATRDITNRLYGGDLELRIQQEIVLGIGGYRVLEALAIDPPVYHLNEGHSAFLALERIRRLIERHAVPFATAREAASAGLIFTTHTPVPAGHDRFPPDLMEHYFGDYSRSLGLTWRDFLALGRQNPDDPREPFCMTTLALRLAARSNGVSRLHGQVTRQMWQGLWPDVPEDDIPIGQITNGVHFRSWLSGEMGDLYDRYIGPRWRAEPAEHRIWQRVERVPAEELWRVHERRRERLIAFTRRRLRAQLEQQGAPPAEIEQADEVLDSKALTIGFSRRFATYKRATLLLRDPDRLARILGQPARPVQVIFAGKAHPQDTAGKEMIRQLVSLTRDPRFQRRLVFLQDYDLTVARALVQGCDVWLNTPRRPLEASGTSGMKAAANGVLNLSTLDGWWDEAWRRADPGSPPIGWAIGRGDRDATPEDQDAVEAESLYDLLENDVVPTFYDRTEEGLPRRWIGRMKSSIGALCHFFNTHRMVREYTERFYLPAALRYADLTADGLARAGALADWLVRIRAAWPEVRVEAVTVPEALDRLVGASFPVQARIQLGPLSPEDVDCELYLGLIDADGHIIEAEATPLDPIEPAVPDGQTFGTSAAACRKSGLHGFTVRVLPRHPDLATPFVPGLITWAEAASGAAPPPESASEPGNPAAG